MLVRREVRHEEECWETPYSIGRANVRDSHATLILVEKLPLEGGTKLTRDFAASIGRSHHVVDMSAANAKEDALAWLRQFAGMSSALVLNVAGPRESKSPGIQAKTTVSYEARRLPKL